MQILLIDIDGRARVIQKYVLLSNRFVFDHV